MKCDHVRKNILDLDGINTFPEDEKMKRHLENCKECRTFYHEIQQSWNLLDDVYILEPQTDFNTSVWGKIQDKMSRSWWHISSLSFASPALRAAACAVVLVIGLAVGYVAFYSPQPEQVVFTSADQEDHQMLMELDELLKFDESQFLSIYQDWDLAKESNEEKEMSSPSSEDEKTPKNLDQSLNPHFSPGYAARSRMVAWIQGARRKTSGRDLFWSLSTFFKRNAVDAWHSGFAAGSW